MSEIVFGPNRPNAARKAVEALRSARERLSASHPYAGEYDGLLARVRAAEVVRAQYGEYGDSLFGCACSAGVAPTACAGHCVVGASS
jgi:hypothetical protein